MTDIFDIPSVETAEEPNGFTAEDLAEALHYPNLGPEYFKARRVAERVMANMEPEGFKPMIERMAKEFQEFIWDSVRDSIISDTELNVAGHIRGSVEATVFALLTGQRWALERYPLAKYSDGQAVRKAIIEHCGAELIDKVKRDEDAVHRYLTDRYRRLRRAA